MLALTEIFVISTTVLVGLVTYNLAKIWYQTRLYPPGPFPIPILGNLLLLRQVTKMHETVVKLVARYGDPFTIWVGAQPTVIISDPESIALCHHGPLRTHFAGRVKVNFGKYQTKGCDNIFFNDMDLAWDALRKVASRAIRKYANGNRLVKVSTTIAHSEFAEAASSCHDPIVQRLVEDIVQNIMAVSAFGYRLGKNDPELITFRKRIDDFQQHASTGLPSDLAPILGYIFYRKERLIRQAIDDFSAFLKECYIKAKKDYTPGGPVRHFTDAMQAARDEAISEERSIAPFLTENNLLQIVILLFGAGIQSTRTTLSWAILRLASDSELQKRLRSEVLQVLGNNDLCVENREQLPRVNAFLLETMRVHPPSRFLVLHQTMCNTQLSNRCIPKGTAVMFNLWAQLHNPDSWPDPERFDENRFLTTNDDDNTVKLAPKKPPEYCVFGIGPRACPGEKLANVEMLYVIVTLLKNFELSSPSVNLKSDPHHVLLTEAQTQTIQIRSLNHK